LQSTPSSYLPSAEPLTTGDYIVGLKCLRRLAQRAVRDNTSERRVVAEVDDFTVYADEVDEGPEITALAESLYDEVQSGLVLENAATLQSGTYARVTLKTDELEGVADLVRASRHGWELICVESGTSVKGSYLDRMQFLGYVAHEVGLYVTRYTVITLDKGYRLSGTLVAAELLRSNDVTAATARGADAVRETVAGLLDTWRNPHEILEDADYRCRRPDTCDACRPYLPVDAANSIFSLHRGGDTSRGLYRSGVMSILDIPSGTPLSEAQRIQVDAVRRNQPYVDRRAVARFLARLTYPLYFLDFEAFMYAVPPYPMNKPWQHIAFQYSLHIAGEPERDVVHRSHIAAPGVDPRPEVLDSLYRNLGEKGSIIVYGRTFESGVLRRLGREFEGYSSWAGATIARVVDLGEPFQNFHLYHPAQKGRISMKRVLPAWTGVGYGDQEIGDGRSASLVYQALCRRNEQGDPVDAETLSRVWRHLEEYCALDTYGMYLIHRRLSSLVLQTQLD
jgi:hypothetical protein